MGHAEYTAILKSQRQKEEAEGTRRGCEGNAGTPQKASRETKYHRICSGCMRTQEEIHREHKATNCVRIWEVEGAPGYIIECIDCRTERKKIEEKRRQRTALKQYVEEQLATIGIREKGRVDEITNAFGVETGTEPADGSEGSARLRRLKDDQRQRCKERRLLQVQKGRHVPQCTRCCKGPTDSMPDSIVVGCDECRLAGDHLHGLDPLRDFCMGCGTGMPTAKMSGGIRFNRKGDEEGTWWCDPCDITACAIQKLESELEEATKAADEAWKTERRRMHATRNCDAGTVQRIERKGSVHAQHVAQRKGKTEA